MLSETTMAGRLTKDPFSGTTENGKTFTNFTLAVQRDYKDPKSGKYEADFFPITVWGKPAAYVKRNCRKGNTVVCVGRFVTYERVNENGEKFKTMSLNVQKIYTVNKELAATSEEMGTNQ